MIFLTFYKFSGIPFKYQALEENYVTIKNFNTFPEFIFHNHKSHENEGNLHLMKENEEKH